MKGKGFPKNVTRTWATLHRIQTSRNELGAGARGGCGTCMDREHVVTDQSQTGLSCKKCAVWEKTKKKFLREKGLRKPWLSARLGAVYPCRGNLRRWGGGTGGKKHIWGGKKYEKLGGTSLNKRRNTGVRKKKSLPSRLVPRQRTRGRG